MLREFDGKAYKSIKTMSIASIRPEPGLDDKSVERFAPAVDTKPVRSLTSLTFTETVGYPALCNLGSSFAMDVTRTFPNLQEVEVVRYLKRSTDPCDTFRLRMVSWLFTKVAGLATERPFTWITRFLPPPPISTPAATNEAQGAEAEPITVPQGGLGAELVLSDVSGCSWKIVLPPFPLPPKMILDDLVSIEC